MIILHELRITARCIAGVLDLGPFRGRRLGSGQYWFRDFSLVLHLDLFHLWLYFRLAFALPSRFYALHLSLLTPFHGGLIIVVNKLFVIIKTIWNGNSSLKEFVVIILDVDIVVIVLVDKSGTRLLFPRFLRRSCI